MSGLTKKLGQICSGELLLFPPGMGSLSSTHLTQGSPYLKYGQMRQPPLVVALYGRR